MRRRAFVFGIATATVAVPGLASAQTVSAVRRIAIDINAPIGDALATTRLDAFEKVLTGRGWTIGRDLLIDKYWTSGSVREARRSAEKIATSKPEVVVTTGTMVTSNWVSRSASIPTVFVLVPDPVGAGIVDSLSRPSGNVTGFMQFEFSLASKWLELLRDLDPALKRVGVLRDVATPSNTPMFASIQAAGHRLGVDVVAINLSDRPAIERGIAEFAKGRGGLIALPGGRSVQHRQLIIDEANRHRLAAVYPYSDRARSGGLMSYGPGVLDLFRNAAQYVDRILKGEKPSELPVQAPTRFELVINLKTAKALGIEVPPMLLARADEVIE